MAVRNEERAFALWTYIAAQAEAPAIREAAERMAKEELGHAAMLRRERRRAYHAERDRPGMATSVAAPRLPPVQEAMRAERGLAALLTARAEGEDASAPWAPDLRRLAAEAAGMAEQAAAAVAAEDAAPGTGGQAAPSSGEGPGGLTAVRRLAERAVEAYLDAADAARDEATMHRLQDLAERAIARVALLRRVAEAAERRPGPSRP
jgi:hypothetical protein